ncbi:competence/damage-inducible protein A [Salinibaculum salinum]|uniref:competence/damage-inducible protein A n=1 Tax=Salinibaculum salinum TaxID=3131996 RepID=UPI0030EC9492
MEVALLTVGDELLAGDTANTNATWLAERLTERGVTVTRILTIPDQRALIAQRVREYSDDFDAVIVTGGIGGTPDDVTLDAVADAFDREMVVSEQARSAVEQRLDEIGDAVPDLDLDVDAEATFPEGARLILNPEGLSPGCIVKNVYVFPGIPRELKAMFGTVAEEFVGEAVSHFLYTVEPEANIVSTLEAIAEEFDVSVGCYPDRDARHNRLKLTATDEETLAEATAWLRERVNTSETPVERDWSRSDAYGDRE